MLPQRVYWKRRWADEWIEVPELFANSVEWACAPSISAAELEFRFGRYLSPGATAFTARFREYNRARYLIKVEIDTHTLQEGGGGDTLKWYGTLEIESEDQFGAIRPSEGAAVWYASGKTYFTCYGLEQQLELEEVITARVLGNYGEEVVRRGLTFNDRATPNRNPNLGADGGPLFNGVAFYTSEYWSTRQAVEYLLTYHKPTDANGQSWFPFVLDDATNVLPTWDRPQIETHGASVRSLLNALIPRERLTTWRLDVTDTEIKVVPFTFTESPIPLVEPAGYYIQSNPNTIRIASETDRGASMVVKRSSLDAADQVIAQGARRTSTATFSFIDGTLEKKWSDADELEYDGGGQSEGTFPAAGEIELKAQYVINYRNRDKYTNVYRRFWLPVEWEGLVGDGTSGSLIGPLMPEDDDPSSPRALALDDWRFAPQLALKEGFNYEDLTNIIEVGPKPHEWLRPIVLFPIPLPEDETEPAAALRRYTNGDTASLSMALESVPFPVSIRAHCSREDGCLHVDVMNGTQDMIASDDFVPIPDIDLEVTGVSYRDMLATVTVEWSEYAEGVYPEDAPFGLDAARRMVILAGDTYRCDYLFPNTVVGLEPDGTLQRCFAGGFIQDDRTKLKGIAQTAFAWYGQTRRAIDFSTSLVTSAVKVGDFVTELGDPDIPGDIVTEDINSVVTSIRIEYRLSETDAGVPSAVQAPRMTVQTAFGELDVRRLVVT